MLGVSDYNDDGPNPWYVGPSFLLAYISFAFLVFALLTGAVLALVALARRFRRRRGAR